MDLVRHGDELVRVADALLSQHQSIMRQDDREIAEDRIVW
jgi:hypothetical protein